MSAAANTLSEQCALELEAWFILEPTLGAGTRSRSECAIEHHVQQNFSRLSEPVVTLSNTAVYLGDTYTRWSALVWSWNLPDLNHTPTRHITATGWQDRHDETLDATLYELWRESLLTNMYWLGAWGHVSRTGVQPLTLRSKTIPELARRAYAKPYEYEKKRGGVDVAKLVY